MNGVHRMESIMSRLQQFRLILPLLALLTASTGCSWMQPANWGTMYNPFSALGGEGGTLTVRSFDDSDENIRGTFQSGIYTTADANTATMVLFDGPPENPKAALTIRMFWNPHAGRTPIDATATNATLQYILFDDTGKEIAIYSGAGYFYPNNSLGSDSFTGSLWQSSLRIADKSEGFDDKIGMARIDGKFTVTRDDLAVNPALHQLNVQIRQRLGRTRLVKSEEHQDNKTTIQHEMKTIDPIF